MVPSKNNYPSLEPSRDIMGQAFPYLAAALKSAGHDVFGLNINNEWCRGSAKKALRQCLRNAFHLYEPEIVCVGGLSADFLFIRDTIDILRHINPDIPVICGGGIISSDKDYVFRTLKPEFAVMGEGEETIRELVDSIDNNRDFEEIAGIAFWKEGEPQYTSKRKPISELDRLHLPDYDVFDFHSFISLLNQTDNYFHCRTRTNPRLMPIITARSCPFSCTFCYHTTGKIYRVRSVDAVIQEIIFFYEKYQFNLLKLYDELFSSDENRVREFCQRLKQLGLDIDWSCSMRVCDVNRDMLMEMKDAGCIHIAYGFESASPKVLKSMKKGITVEQIRKTIELTDEAGIGIQANFIFGDIAETPETIRETLHFYNIYCKDLIIHCDYITPYPGTELFEHCLENGIIPDRKLYYETIHTRPRINMTQMSYYEFHKLTDPVVRNRYRGFKSAAIASFQVDHSCDFDRGAPPKLKRDTYRFRLECPHCKKKSDYLLPLKSLFTPIVQFCTACHKKFILPTMQITQKRSIYEKSLHPLKSLTNTQKPVIIGPVPDASDIEILDYYGFNYRNLNIVGFMDWRPWPSGSRFLRYPVIDLTTEILSINGDGRFIVLPLPGAMEILRKLRRMMVPNERIVYIRDLPVDRFNNPDQPEGRPTLWKRFRHGALNLMSNSQKTISFYNSLYKISRILFPRPL